jgi:RimJ/RimL family protein N-acetyltransferase
LTILQTKTLILTPCCTTDRAEFMALEHDPEVMRFLNGGYAVDHSKPNLDAPFLMPRGTEDYVWTGRRTSNGVFVGWFCLWPEREKVGELGYRLDRIQWGQGLATEGARALVNWGFGSDRYDKIFASTLMAHAASRRVLEKTGMIHARTAYASNAPSVPGSENGEAVYELMRRDWNDN